MYHNFYIHSTVDGHLGNFYVLAIVNSATMDIGVRVSFSILFLLGYMPGSCIVGGNVNWYSHYGRWYGDSLKPPYDPEIPLLGTKTEETDFEKNWFTLRKPKLKKNTCIPLFTAALFTIARIWKQPRWLSTDEWIKKLRYMYTMEYYTAIEKEHIWVSSNEVDDPRAYYTEWSK